MVATAALAGEHRGASGHTQEDRGEGWSAWRPDPAAPLLLLGDSFTNVFSLAEMGWGEEGGFAETLSQSLGFSIDRIARNADGAFASRRELQQDPGRLEGKSVVVWQFAARELSLGDWKVLDLRRGGEPTASEPGPGEVEIEGIIAAVSKNPPLKRTPYRQAVMEIHLREVRGVGADLPGELVLLGMGLEDRVPTEMTSWKAGRRLKVKVVPWSSARERYGRLHRFALDDPGLELIDLGWFWMLE